MILDTHVKVKLGPKNISHYKALGYSLPIGKDKRGRLRIVKEERISVKLSDLPPTSKAKIRVQCEVCNTIRSVEYDSVTYRVNSGFLKSGETLCNTCANKRMSGVNSGNYVHGNILYPMYRSNARRRGISFSLSVVDFESLIPGTCFYCSQPSNGIDRFNNKDGYTRYNCVSCCGECNFYKRNKSPIDFIKKIELIFNTLKNKGFIS